MGKMDKKIKNAHKELLKKRKRKEKLIDIL